MILWSQVEFTASSNVISVPVGQSFSVTYVLKGANPETFTKPAFNGFRLIGQQSYTGGGGFQIIINNQVVNNGESDNRWIFTLKAMKEGTFTIGPAKVKAGGQVYSSNSVEITVTKGGNAVANNSGSQNNSSNNSGGQDDGKITEYAYLTATPDKKSVYVGEPVIVSYRIYTLVDISQYGVDKTESMDGFWIEDLVGPSTKAKTWEETINGEVYLVGEIRKVALYPQNAGTYTIPALDVEAILKIPQSNSNDPFDFFNKFFSDPFGSDPFKGMGVTQEKRILSSPPININVKPLPEQGKPKSFENAVGDFDASIKIDKKRCLTGDGLILKLTVTGQGNLMLVDAPDLEIPPGIRLYDPETNDDFSANINGINGTREFEYMLVPEIAGEYKLGPWEFSWFNPNTGAYKTKKFDPINLKVAKGSGSGPSSGTCEVEKDIRYIHEKIPSGYMLLSFMFTNIFWIYFGAIWLVFFIILYFMRKHIKLRSNLSEFKMKMALRVAKNRLKKANKYSKEGKENEFFQELSQAMWLYITDKFAVPISDLSVDNVKGTLLKNGIEEDLTNRFTEILQACDFARFAPVSDKGNLIELYDKASKLIVDVQTGVK